MIFSAQKSFIYEFSMYERNADELNTSLKSHFSLTIDVKNCTEIQTYGISASCSRDSPPVAKFKKENSICLSFSTKFLLLN